MEHSELGERMACISTFEKKQVVWMLASMYSYCARNQQVFNPIVFLKYFTFVLLNPLSWIVTSASLAEEHSWSQDGDSTSSCNTLHPSCLHPCSILWPFHLCWEDSFLEQGLKHGWMWTTLALNLCLITDQPQCYHDVQGYTGKMYLDQGWLSQQTSDSVFWRLTATFQNEVKEFKGSRLHC